MRILWLSPLLLAACRPGAKPAGAFPTDSGEVPNTGCNGHDILCDRALSAVTFPGTHNSMSSAADEWLGPNQPDGIGPQLDAGIRALMLDTHAWEDGLWLCHGSCELGAQPLAEGLGEIRDFLDAHPREVVQIIFQDAIPLADSRAALDDAGLGTRLYRWTEGADPTLRQLIDAGTPLVVGLESGNSDGNGIHGAWDLWVDTPYSFNSLDEFSCEQNRGAAENPLFLVNHWLGPLPAAALAAEANDPAVLEARARQCAEEWGRAVNFLGVDHYDQGDLFGVVDRLNGVD